MLADRIADFLFKGGNITDEEKEIICFGLESLEGNLLGIGLTLIVGMCFRQVREGFGKVTKFDEIKGFTRDNNGTIHDNGDIHLDGSTEPHNFLSLIHI